MKDFSSDEFQQSLKELDVYGYTHIKGLLNQEEIDKYLQLIRCLYQDMRQRFSSGYEGGADRDVDDMLIYNLQNKNIAFIDLLSTKWVEEIAKEKLNDRYHRFLPDEDPNYIMMQFNARSSGSKLDLHIDSRVPYVGSHTITMQFMFLLEDMYETNGCTFVVPGSHNSGKYTDREMRNKVHVTGKAGDMICWDSRIWHGANENNSGLTRWVIIATLGQWWIKPCFNIIESLPQEIYENLSNKQKALMGYCAIPPANEFQRVNKKQGYDFLKPKVEDYF